MYVAQPGCSMRYRMLLASCLQQWTVDVLLMARRRTALCCRGHNVRPSTDPAASQDPHQRVDSVPSQRSAGTRGDLEAWRQARQRLRSVVPVWPIITLQL